MTGSIKSAFDLAFAASPIGGDVDKRLGRQAGAVVEKRVSDLEGNLTSGTMLFSLQADLFAWTGDLLVLPAKAEVIADPVAENNGIYRNATGGVGASAWTKIYDLPPELIQAIDAGLGTANAIKATTNRIPADAGLVSFAASHANTSSDVTIEFGDYPAVMTLDDVTISAASAIGSPVGEISVSFGNPVYDVRTASGAKPPVGSIVPGMPMLGRVDETSNQFRLLSDVASTSIQNVAIVAQQSATASAAAAAQSAAIAQAAAEHGDLANYSTTSQIATMLTNYTPKSRSVSGSDGVLINDEASGTLASNITIGLDYATEALGREGLDTEHPMNALGTAAAIAALGGMAPRNTLQFVSSGNYTASATAKFALILIVGGFGGGGAKVSEGNDSAGWGGNGGYGGFGAVFVKIDPGQVYPVVVGAAGGPAGAGGSSYITIDGIVYSASGGAGGGNNGAVGANGAPSATCLFGGIPTGPIATILGNAFSAVAGNHGFYPGAGTVGRAGRISIVEFGG